VALAPVSGWTGPVETAARLMRRIEGTETVATPAEEATAVLPKYPL